MKVLSVSPFRFLKKRIPAYNILIVLAGAALIMGWKEHSLSGNEPAIVKGPPPSSCPESMIFTRLGGIGLVHPLLMVDLNDESEKLSPLKNDLSWFIKQKEQTGEITDASVYLRSFKDGSWFTVNSGDMYNPGSMMKLPVMITYLKEAEKDPGILNKELVYQPRVKIPLQTFNGKAIEAGKKYKVKELLHYMIVESDNNATYLLNENVNLNTFQKLFSDLDLSVPDTHDANYAMTASDYSKFMRILYSSSYLNIESSEFALVLLTQSTFKNGMLQQLPSDLKVAHKFGENFKNNLHQLHESGIVYIENHPYLLTVMTKGNDVNVLPAVISELSKKVYDAMSAGQ
ncbi:MAG TPA: serine hydrolase [Chitinophagales bacterium]|nr:serine hydrolase [Chitinophagales bacterium]